MEKIFEYIDSAKTPKEKAEAINNVSFMLQAQTNGFAEFKMDELGIKKYQPTWKMSSEDSLFVEISNGQKYLLHTKKIFFIGCSF